MSLSIPKAYALLKSLSVSKDKIETVLGLNKHDARLCRAAEESVDFTDNKIIMAREVNLDVKNHKCAGFLLNDLVICHRRRPELDLKPVNASTIQEYFLKPTPITSIIGFMYAAGATDYHVAKVMGLRLKKWMKRIVESEKLKKERFGGRMFFLCKLTETIVIRGFAPTPKSFAKSVGFDGKWVSEQSEPLRTSYGWERGIPAKLRDSPISSKTYHL